MKKRPLLVKLAKNIYQIPATKPGSHSYLLLGDDIKVLIDPGIAKSRENLKKAFKKLKLSFKDIDLVINTHEHYDHIGANRFFQDTAMVAAARSAASKINLQDEYATLCKARGENCYKLKVHLSLENITKIELGGITIKIYITPAQSSGCLCIYEVSNQFLFSGDTVFARGTMPTITSSGSLGDYVDSLERLSILQIKKMYPGHGLPSTNPKKDLKLAIKHAKNALAKERKKLPPIIFR